MRNTTGAASGGVIRCPRRCSGLVAVLVMLASAGQASAHPTVDEARHLVDQADFAAAEQAFGRAEAATDLTRDDLVALLEGRALLHHALADTAALEADLARLAALDPRHAFGPGLPPELSDTFLRVRTRSAGALRLSIDVRPVPGGLALRATAHNDPAGLVRALEVHGRVADEPWRTAGEELVVSAPPGANVQTWARARGPGGAVVAERGSADDPSAAVIPGAIPLAAPAEPPSDGGTHGERRARSVWPWIAGGAAVVAAAITAVVLVWTVRSDETSVGAPELRGR